MPYVPPSLDDFRTPMFFPKGKDPGAPDIFADRKRKAWNEGHKEIPRCDFKPGRARIHLYDGFRIITLWRRSIMGMTFEQVKESDDMVRFFADNMAPFIRQVIGSSLDPSQFAIVVPPKRRHKVRNFATEVAKLIAPQIGIPFYEDFCECHSRARVNAVFTPNFIPDQKNILVVDDFCTTGSTLIAMHRLLDSIGKNSIVFAAVLNKK